MQNPLIARRVFSLALCFVLQLPLAIKAQTSTDLLDSDEFFQRTTRRAPDRDYTKQIDDLLARMTLEEKVGQMTQLALAMVISGRDQDAKIDQAKLEKAIVKYGVGSILNVSDQALTVDKWHEFIGQIQETAVKKTRLGIPMIYGIDSIHGANFVQGATLFPQEIGMAATWNPELMKHASEITAIETRAAGIPWSFSPVLDLGRTPLWPRFWETFGEDPYLAKVMGVAFVRGLEGTDVAAQDRVASSLKHYMGYSLPLTGRDRTPAWITETQLREYVLPTFAAAVKAGAIRLWSTPRRSTEFRDTSTITSLLTSCVVSWALRDLLCP